MELTDGELDQVAGGLVSSRRGKSRSRITQDEN